MRVLLRSFLLLSILAGLSVPVSAQRRKKPKKEEAELSPYDVDTLKAKIPIQRATFHDAIDKEQKRADYYDGSYDGTVYYEGDTLYTGVLTQALLKDVDRIQVMIENLEFPDAQTANQTKIRYIRAVSDLLRRLNAETRLDPYAARKQVTALREMIIARHEGRISQYAREHASRAVLSNVALLAEDPEARTYLYSEVAKQEPRWLVRKLGEFAAEPYACAVLAEAAKTSPNEVYAFASSSNASLSGAVRRCDDPLVRTIARISTESKSPLKALPFLADIHAGRRTVNDVDKITSNADDYYKALVQLKIGGESVGGDTYTDELRYRCKKYIREMNELHDAADAVRFKCLEGMSPEDLYFIIVYSDNEIYTSSYLGTYKRMMERLKPATGDALFEKVRYDRFRTFIRLCANYNTLSPFLATINEEKKSTIMRDFMANLEKGREEELLTNAVDVADAFSSVADSSLGTFLRKEVTANYERCKSLESREGIIVYGLLATLFKSFSEGEVEAERIGLPPIKTVAYSSLANDSSGRVHEVMFFYGDEDGRGNFNSYTAGLRGAGYKVTSDKYWVRADATGGKPFTIWMNQPLPEPEDEEAQNKLMAHLREQSIKPSILVHRGHSYHLPLTLEQIRAENRVVVLGSCGGYNNLGTVLKAAPDAHIISSKQTGVGTVNNKILAAIHQRLLKGADLDWVQMWKELNSAFASGTAEKGYFDDYVPPHKNLGVIFIKAYRRLVADEELLGAR